MARGKETFYSLRALYRMAEWRRFRTRHRSNRFAEVLGLTPDGTHMIGFWEGTEDPIKFTPDDTNWTDLTTYV